MGVKFEIKRKITVDGRDYESLDQIPHELRTAVKNALAPGAAHKTTIHINGKTYSSLEEMPAPLRAVVGGLTAFALKKAAGATADMPDAQSPAEVEAHAVQPEPVLSVKTIVVAAGLATLLFWLARRAF
jgi:hypothetical protein